MSRTPLGHTLPDFPWNSLAGAKEKAQAHPDGIVDLSVGNPVDPVAPGVQLALSAAAEAPGYPQTQGTPELREAIAKALQRRYNMNVDAVLPVIGTKEAIAWLPTLLGMRGETVAFPTVAYPTYEVGALLAGAKPLRADDDFQDASLVFINSPSNPTGKCWASRSCVRSSLGRARAMPSWPQMSATWAWAGMMRTRRCPSWIRA